MLPDNVENYLPAGWDRIPDPAVEVYDASDASYWGAPIGSTLVFIYEINPTFFLGPPEEPLVEVHRARYAVFSSGGMLTGVYDLGGGWRRGPRWDPPFDVVDIIGLPMAGTPAGEAEEDPDPPGRVTSTEDRASSNPQGESPPEPKPGLDLSLVLVVAALLYASS